MHRRLPVALEHARTSSCRQALSTAGSGAECTCNIDLCQASVESTCAGPLSSEQATWVGAQYESQQSKQASQGEYGQQHQQQRHREATTELEPVTDRQAHASR